MDVQNVMLKIRTLVDKSGLTHREIGLRMGYPPESGRQSVSQFLRGTHPSLEMLLRFAKAMNLKVEDLL